MCTGTGSPWQGIFQFSIYQNAGRLQSTECGRGTTDSWFYNRGSLVCFISQLSCQEDYLICIMFPVHRFVRDMKSQARVGKSHRLFACAEFPWQFWMAISSDLAAIKVLCKNQRPTSESINHDLSPFLDELKSSPRFGTSLLNKLARRKTLGKCMRFDSGAPHHYMFCF